VGTNQLCPARGIDRVHRPRMVAGKGIPQTTQFSCGRRFVRGDFAQAPGGNFIEVHGEEFLQLRHSGCVELDQTSIDAVQARPHHEPDDQGGLAGTHA
jgi:hypothetical protein